MKTTKQKKMLIEELEKNPIIEFACKKVGIARATYYRWITKNKEFAEATKEALEKGVFLINDLADAQLISLIKDKNLSAIKFWSIHRHPAYSEKLQFMKYLALDDEELDDRKLTPEEQVLINNVIKLNYGKDWTKKPKEVKTVRINKILAYNIAS